MLQFLLSLLLSPALLALPQDAPPSASAQQGDEEVAIPEGILQDEGTYITLRFDETDEGGITLRQFVKVAQMVTGLNFTIDETGNANTRSMLDSKKLLLYGSKRIRKTDFYPFFQIMMKINGFVCVQQGSGDLAVIVITSDNQTTRGMVKQNAIFVEGDDVEAFRDQPGTYIATVFRLRYGEAQSLGVNLRTALGGGGAAGGTDSFMPLPQEHALLVQGFGPFVAAAVRMLKILDVQPFTVQPEFAHIPLQEASAEELAQLLTDLLQDLQGAKTQPTRGRGADTTSTPEIETRISANPRDNSLLVVASKENMELVKDLVAKLDTKVEIPETNFRIYQLQNIAAEDLQQDLKKFLDRTRQAQEQSNRSSSSQGGSSRRNDQQIIVEPQAETNSLLITATRTKWEELKRLLDRLDQRQPQVLIETALIEVSEDFTKDLGVELASVDPPTGNYSKGFGFTSVGISTLLDTDGDNQPDTRIVDSGATGFTAGILDGKDFGLPILLAAAQNRSDTNILSVPSLLVTNNRGATVESLDQIPTATQTPVASVGVTSTFNNFQEAGISLTITPSISAQKYLRLGITLEVSAFRGTFTPGSTIPPPKTTRKLNTTVYLPDGATMWIGGIVRDDMLHDETGVPWLSDIPVLGWVFSRNTHTNTKTTLFFFCTPRILDDFGELADISEKGKARAADVIGLDRVQRVDPNFRLKNPLDVILDQDVNGDGNPETGVLDLSGFAAPVYVSGGGEEKPKELRGSTPPAPQTPPNPPHLPESGGDGRNLPEGY